MHKKTLRTRLNLIMTAALLASLLLTALPAQAASGDITTVAGNATLGWGYSGDGGPATSAQLNYSWGVALDGAGNLFIADTSNHVIRRVDAATGIITTVAGTGGAGYSGDGGPATSAQLYNPSGVALDGAGNLFIADTYNQRVRRVDAATGVITTVAGTGSRGYSGDGGPATSAQLSFPIGMALDEAGNIFIANTNHVIRRVDAASGIITTVAGTGSRGYSGDGGPATSAQLFFPYGLVLDGAGNLFIADTYNHRIRRVDAASGIITTVAGTGSQGYGGDGGSATSASMNVPYAVALDGAGNLFIADAYNSVIRRVDAATGIITTVVGTVYGYSGDGGPATSARLSYPYGVALDGAGNLFIGDYFNHVIRRVETIGVPTINTETASVTGDGYSDGWVLERAETYETGYQTDNKTKLLRVGDDRADRQYRAILSFDTRGWSSLDIQGGTVLVKPHGEVGAPFGLGQLCLQAAGGHFGSSWRLERQDFQAAGSGSPASCASLNADGWYEFSVAAGDINTSGWSQFRLYFELDDNDNRADDYLMLHGGYAGGSAPVLEVDYIP